MIMPIGWKAAPIIVRLKLLNAALPADALHGVVGFVEGGALLITAGTAIGAAIHGARQAFGYGRRGY